MDYSFSPNFNVEKGQFEHPEGDKSDKGILTFSGSLLNFSVVKMMNGKKRVSQLSHQTNHHWKVFLKI